MGKTSRNGEEGASYPDVERYHVQMLTDPTVSTFKLSITCDSHDLICVTGALLAIFRYQLILDIPKEESRCSFGVIRIIFDGDGQVRQVVVKSFVDQCSCLFIATSQRFVCFQAFGRKSCFVISDFTDSNVLHFVEIEFD